MPSDGICMLVAADRVGRVIGAKGAALKQMRERTRCSIEVAKEESWNATRQVSIVGSNDGVADAFGQVVAKAYHEDLGAAEGIVALPTELAGKAIGKGGANLKEIRRRTDCYVVMEKDPITLDREGAQARIAIFKGGPEQMAAGLRMMIGFLTEGPGGGGPPPPSHSPPPPGYGDGYGRQGGHDLPPAPQWSPPPAAGYGGGSGYGTRNGGAPSRAGPGRPTHRGMPPPQMMHGGDMMMRGGRENPMAPPMLSKIQHPGQDPAEMQVHMTVPHELAGNLIGKGGERVKTFQKTSGCRFVIMSERNMGARRIVMVGGFNEVVSAQKTVFDAINEELAKGDSPPLEEVECVVLVRREAAGKLIGKGGENIKEIREQCGVRCDIAREEIQGFRLCTLRGALNDVNKAQQNICEVVAEVPIGGDGGGKRKAEGDMGGNAKAPRR